MVKNVCLSLATGVVRVNAGTYKRAAEKGNVARANVLLVATRAGPSACAEQISSREIDDNTSKRYAIHFDANRHGRSWEVINEIRRAVDRVDDPSDSSLTSNGRTLLTQDAVVGALLEDALHERPLGPFVCAGDWTPMVVLESDRPSGIRGSLANAACNVGSEGDCNVEEFLGACHICHVSAHGTSPIVPRRFLDPDPLNAGGLSPGDQLGVPVHAVGDIAVLHDTLVRVDEAPNEGVFVGVDPDHSHDLGLSVVAVAVAEWPCGAQTCVKAPRGSSL